MRNKQPSFIDRFTKIIKPKSLKPWVSLKLKTIVKMQDWAMPKENNKGC
jgi:hypothetical protein